MHKYNSHKYNFHTFFFHKYGLLSQEKDAELAALRLQMEQMMQAKDVEIAVLRQQVAAAAGGDQQEQAGPAQQRQGAGGGPKRKSWDDLHSQQKRRSTEQITAQLEVLSEERNTEPSKIAAHLLHRLASSSHQSTKYTFYPQGCL